jgi:phage-related protein
MKYPKGCFGMNVRFLREETEKFIEDLDQETITHVHTALALLRTYGQEARYPHTRKVARGIFELRTLGKQNIRLFFCFHKGEAVILHAFIKKTYRIPKSEIEYALKLYKYLH